MTTTMPTTSLPYNEKRIRRFAWGIIIVSFLTLCALTLTSSLAVYYFFFESTVPINTMIRVGRGTTVVTDADLTERALRLQDALVSRPALISTDSQSQAEISFHVLPEPYNIHTLATLTLQRSTQFEVTTSTQPRFDWSNGRYEIQISDVIGIVNITVVPDLPRPLLIQINTANGGTIHITGAGRYVIDVNENRLRLINREGAPAVLFGRNPAENVVVDGGKIGLLVSGRNTPVATTNDRNILQNSQFFIHVADLLADNPNAFPVPTGWGCTNFQDQLPRGEIAASDWQGRTALRLTRGDNASSNGQTRCKHPFGDAGMDVTEYNHLELDTTFLINYQSLSECGIEGSECPLMLQLEYIDVNGNPRQWFKGFYYHVDPQYSYFKSRCASCIEDHQRINEKTWYTYRTGNLFGMFPDDQRPARITSVEFYASGHQYDVFISDIAMMVGIADAILTPIDANPPADEDS